MLDQLFPPKGFLPDSKTKSNNVTLQDHLAKPMPGEWVDCKRRRRTCIRKNAQNTPRRPGGAAEMPKPRFAQASTGENMASVFKILRILRRPHRNVTDFLQSLCDRPVVRARIHVLQLRHGYTFVAYARETRCKGYCGVVNNRPSTLFMCMEGEGRRFGWAKRIYISHVHQRAHPSV